MSKRTLAVLFVILLFSWPGTAAAQSDALRSAYDQCNTLQDQGRYGDAEPLFKRALAIKEKAFGPDHPGVALGLSNLASLYNAQGRYGEAEPLHKRALAIMEKALGPEHPNVATSLENYAKLLRKTERDAEAEELEARGKAIRARHAEKNP
jgi:tetratricopeptide (TPR) repeat protein